MADAPAVTEISVLRLMLADPAGFQRKLDEFEDRRATAEKAEAAVAAREAGRLHGR